MKKNNHSWPQPYLELAGALARLYKDNLSATLLGASLVHPRHPIPPEHLVLLEALQRRQKIPIPGFLSILLKAGESLLSALYDTVFLFLIGLQSKPAASEVEVIVKTWVLTMETLQKKTDFYMGEISSLLAGQNRASILLAGDGRPDDGRLISKLKIPFKTWDFIKRSFKTREPKYFPEIALVPFWVPLRCWGNQLFLSFRLVRYAYLHADDLLLGSVAALATVDVLRPYTTKNLYQRTIGRQMGKWSPGMVITLYEGQPWEKVFWEGVKEAVPKALIVGYQHTVVMPHSLALTNPELMPGKVPTPDLLLCTGEEAKKLMEQGGRKSKIPTFIYGSHRRESVAMNTITPRPARNRVLVLPEGTIGETTLLFNATIDLAKALPETVFVLRCHPLLDIQKILPLLKFPITQMPNVFISKNASIQTDFHEVSCLFYRGSSAVFYAILAGVKPFCLWLPDTPNIDPLWPLKDWREYASSTAELISQIKGYSLQNAEGSLPAWEAAAKFVDGFTKSTRPEALSEVLGHQN